MEYNKEMIDEVVKKVEQRAIHLVGEFSSYIQGLKKDCEEKECPMPPEEACFQTFIFQKLAALQLITENWNKDRPRGGIHE